MMALSADSSTTSLEDDDSDEESLDVSADVSPDVSTDVSTDVPPDVPPELEVPLDESSGREVTGLQAARAKTASKVTGSKFFNFITILLSL
jgi:hypothetical protein